MAKTTVSVPVDGGPVEAVATIETVPYWTRSRRKTGNIFLLAWKPADVIWDVIPSLFAVSAAAMELDTDSVQSVELFKQPSNPAADEKMQPSTPQRQGGVRLHEFVSKTVSIAVFGAEPPSRSPASTC